MKWKNLFFVLAQSLLFTFGWVLYAPAAPLFEENWDLGTIDTSLWDSRSGGDATSGLLLVSPGNWAWFNTGSELNQWANGLASTSNLAFDRGENLRVTFKVWGDLSKPAPNMGRFPDAASINGPWYAGVDVFDTSVDHRIGGGTDFWNEAIVAHWRGPLAFSQGQWDTGPRVSQEFVDNYSHAISRDRALIVRVWLDDATGAMMEWSANGGRDWTVEDGTLTPQIWDPSGTMATDTRGISGRVYLPVASATDIRLGFATRRSTVVIDDIVVENDSNLAPTPTPIISSVLPLFVEDWDTGVIDTNLWDSRSGGEATSGLVLVGPGDYAWFNTGSDFDTWDNGLSSTSNLEFCREDNLRITFKVWGDPSMPAPNTDTFPAEASINGPFHAGGDGGSDNFVFQNADGTPDLASQIGSAVWNEAILDSWGDRIGFAQGNWQNGPYMSQTFHDAFNAATSKGDAVQVRVTLGDVIGSKVEWKTASMPAFVLQDGQVAPAGRTSATDTTGILGRRMGCGIRLGFSTRSTTVLIDDIVVENDFNQLPAGPTPTASMTPVIASVGNYWAEYR